MRRFILVILAVIMAAGTASGEEAPLLTMEEAVAIAQREGIAAALADLSLEEARLAYMEVQANQILRPSVIAQQQGEDAWEAAQAARQLAELDLALQVEQAYYDVLRTDLAIDLAKRALEQAEAQLESTQVRHGLGMVSDVELLAAQSQAATAQLKSIGPRPTAPPPGCASIGSSAGSWMHPFVWLTNLPTSRWR